MTRMASAPTDASPSYQGAKLVGYDKDPAVTYWLKGPEVYYMREKEHSVESGWYCWTSEWPERARRLNIRLVEEEE